MKRTTVLLAGLLLLGTAFFAVRFATREGAVEVKFEIAPSGAAVFAFNDKVEVLEVQVIQPRDPAIPPEGAENLPEYNVLWHLVPREPQEGEDAPQPRPTQALRYGQRIHGLTRSPDMPKNAGPLVPGKPHLFRATLDEGTVELAFVP